MKKMIMTASICCALTSCSSVQQQKSNDDFTWKIDQFDDINILRYQIPGMEDLTAKQKELVYYLSQAALSGRDILFDQNYKYNLLIRSTLEDIYQNYTGDKNSEEFKQFEKYLKKVWFANGIHHHYSTDKFQPTVSVEYFNELVANTPSDKFRVNPNEKALFNAPGIATPYEATYLDIVRESIFNPTVAPKRVNQNSDTDLITNSACNFYEGVNQQEVENYYASITDANDPEPISYGLNTKVVKDKNGKVTELVWSTEGMYGQALTEVVKWLKKAEAVAENNQQKDIIAKLIAYYESGNLKTFDAYNIAWVQDTLSSVDFVNGFIENYGDPMGLKATWESVVNFKNAEATKRTEVISENAQWFEDNSPVAHQFKKKEVKGVSAKVITVAMLGGDCYPSTPIGINLPNADWIRKEHGSKSVTIQNISYAYGQASMGNGSMEEFAYSEEELERAKKYGALAGNLNTDLHECLGHGSGQLAPGVKGDELRNYGSPLEEARASLFATYYLADPKLVELGLIPSLEVGYADFDNTIRNGMMTQLTRIELGKTVEQAHMRCRKLMAEWAYDLGKSENIIERKTRDNKTYFVINNYERLRELFGKMLAEIQRIKSEGDYEAGKALIEKYAVQIDPELHKEVLDRYAALNLSPYNGFVNPILTTVVENGEIVNVVPTYTEGYAQQMLRYSNEYGFLPVMN